MASKASRKTKNEKCVLCCKEIVEGKEEALMCEGEVCCNKWMHRNCAGVPTAHYKLLEESPDPFRCLLCTQLKHAAVVEELRSAIVSLTTEVSELRGALQSATRYCPGSRAQASSEAPQARRDRSWTEVVRNDSRRPNKNGRRKQITPQPASKLPQTLKNSERRTDSVRVRVPGVRRIWGTKKDAPPVTVLQTVRQLTKADSEKKLTVKRKFKEGAPGR